jgi:hypothetical protein
LPTAANSPLAARASTAISTAAASFAVSTRPRSGTSVNVVSAVRWDHSLVTERMPSTGSRTADGNWANVKKSRNFCSSFGAASSKITAVAAAASPMMISNHSPARVSVSLRSSTTVRRCSGTAARRGAPALACCGPEAGGAVSTAVIGRPP